MTGGYDRSIFINCPFDSRYAPLFRATVYTILECGFAPRCSLEVEDSGEVRIRKIKRLIRECRYGIHDISRVQVEPNGGLPRFNMPFELGLFLGAQEYGDAAQRRKQSIILDSDRYRYQRLCSDLAGQDIRAHKNRPAGVVAAVRAWLATVLDRQARIPGEARINERYGRFQAELPDLCATLHLKPTELQFVEMRTLIESWLLQHPLAGS